NKTARIQLCGLSNARPIACSDCPAFHRLQISRFSIAESPNRTPVSCPHHLHNQIYLRWCCIDLSNAPRLSGLWCRPVFACLAGGLSLRTFFRNSAGSRIAPETVPLD